ncbi:hypothetical protein EXT44_29110, partial [Klebsiella pneumoniae]
MGSCAAPSAKGDDKFITTDYLQQCRRPSLVRGRAAQVNPGGFTTPARRPSVPHRTAGCGKSSLRPL